MRKVMTEDFMEEVKPLLFEKEEIAHQDVFKFLEILAVLHYQDSDESNKIDCYFFSSPSIVRNSRLTIWCKNQAGSVEMFREWKTRFVFIISLFGSFGLLIFRHKKLIF